MGFLSSLDIICEQFYIKDDTLSFYQNILF